MSNFMLEQRLPFSATQPITESEWEQMFVMYRQHNAAEGLKLLNEDDFMGMIIYPNMYVGTHLYEGNRYWDSRVITATMDGDLVGFVHHAYNASGTNRHIAVKRGLSALNHLGVPYTPDKVYRTIITRGVAEFVTGGEVILDDGEIFRRLLHSVARREQKYPDREMTIFERSGPDFAKDRVLIEQSGFVPFSDNPKPAEGEPPVLLGYRGSARAILQATAI